MSNVPNFVKDANLYSFVKIRELPKKITPMIVQKQIEQAMVFGNIEGAERILSGIQSLKTQHPECTVADVEAMIHEFMSMALNYAGRIYQHKVNGFPLERILKEHGYYDKEKHENSKTITE